VVPAPSVGADWLQAFQAIQQQTVESQAAYERTMADSHVAFLKLAEATLASMAGGKPPAGANGRDPESPTRATAQPTPVTIPKVEPPVPVPVAAPAEPESTVDLETLLISIVAERTGYPVEMLGAHLELEGDLGIDSIKRVEILSAVRTRLPGLPELDPAELGKLRTIGQISERLGGKVPLAVDEAGGPVRAEPAAHPQRALVADTPLVRLEARAVAAPEPGHRLPGLGEFPLDVTDDGRGIAALLVRGLNEHGVAARVVAHVDADSQGVVFLGGLRDVASTEAALEVNREAFHAARAVAKRFQAQGGVFVTVQDTGGTFGLEGATLPRAWLGGAAALARTAAHEWPSAAVKAIDCECAGRDPETIARALLRELLEGGSTLDVGLRADGTRLTLAPTAVTSRPDPAPALGPDSLIVVSGGARGVTAAAVEALARRYRPRLVLIGRTPLVDEPDVVRGAADEGSLRRVLIDQARRDGRSPTPAQIGTEVAAVLAGREVRATLAALGSAGSAVRYLPVDVRDRLALTDALAEVRRDWGPVTGLVHGAGVLADRLLADLTDEQYERVFSTKVEGLGALLAATANDPLRLMVVFSSISAEVGNPGQCAYAMANSVISQVVSAVAGQRPDCHVRAIAWGPWQGGMVGPELEERFRRQGVAVIPVPAGVRAFLAELESSDRVARVIIGAGGGSGLITVSSDHRMLDVRVGKNHPYLADHAVGGVPVVPVALALEWLARAARTERQLEGRLVLRDARVLHGISLDGFPDRERLLHVRGCTDAREGHWQLRLELRGADDATLYYRASAGSDVGDRPQWTELEGLERFGPPRVYDGHVLFHGPRFQAIRTVEGISAAGAAAVVSGARSLGWPADADWCTDPAAVDGALQVALLWAHRVLGDASLPMAVAGYRLWQRGLAPGQVRCLLWARAVHDNEAECDIACFDEDGSLRAELLGVELVRRPDRPVT
jgi:NADP-dependent 3-hydroxy acid dehydrogenase YdfG